MTEAFLLIPAYVRWALKSPKNLMIFWWLVIILFVAALTAIDTIEKIEKRKGKGGKSKK